MAIAPMKKVMILSHRSEVEDLLEALQAEGIFQILRTEEAAVSRDFPDLAAAADKPRDLEQLVGRLEKGTAFLKPYHIKGDGLASMLAPRMVINEQTYKKVISDIDVTKLLETIEKNRSENENLNFEIENLRNRLNELLPWRELTTPVEELGRLERAVCLVGFMPSQHFEETSKQLKAIGAIIHVVGSTGTKDACIIVCLTDAAEETQKLLRSADFESFSFGDMTGTVADAVADIQTQLADLTGRLEDNIQESRKLAENLPNLKILLDYYNNLLNREQTHSQCPATEQAVVLEGWTKKKDYARLEKLVSQFGASSLHEIEPAENEEPPIEIENTSIIKPFEIVTRLYGMPHRLSIDPTAFLAPFFALFFGLCLTDAGYGLLMMVFFIWMLMKTQVSKRFILLMLACSALTIVAGALTGGWFGDAVQQFIPSLEPVRKKMMWFDPLENPMMFFKLSLVLGYIQILVGLTIAFVHNLMQKDYIAAVFDRLTWLVLLNCVVVFIFVGGEVGKILGYVALLPAAMIFLFSERRGGTAGRLGMGLYNLFSAIFYMGDVLSYLRLMALGMVTAGMAMATNVIAKIALDIPYGIGIIFMVLVLIVGHSFNTAFNALGAFVHTLRLQYAEFFPKFFTGGGAAFRPLSKEYKHIAVENE